MASREGASSQLLPNRNVLAKLGTVVRRKANPANRRVPAEWDPETAQSYRLLIGPKIKEFLPPETPPSSTESVESVEPETTYADLKPKLAPSRLRGSYEPVKVRDEAFNALHLPNDLLVQVFPPGYIRKFDLLDRRCPKTMHKIVRPVVRDATSPSAASSSSLSSSRMSSLVSIPTVRETPRLAHKVVVEEPVHVEEEEKREREPTPEELRMKARTMTVQERQHAMYLRRLRTYFYVLRCWARFKVNTRLKAAFATDVHYTQVEMKTFRQWRHYVAIVTRLKRLRKRVESDWNAKMTKEMFAEWKEKSEKAIKSANVAQSALDRRDQAMLRKVLRCFGEVAHSRRICRRETQKFYKFSPNGPFTEINAHYSIKRDHNVKALNFAFKKMVPRILKLWLDAVRHKKTNLEHEKEVLDKRRSNYIRIWYDSYQDHLHQRAMVDTRRKAAAVIQKIAKSEKAQAQKVEKTLMVQLVRDRHVLDAKLSQFDRLSQNHSEAVLRRSTMRDDIEVTTNDFFRRQEEFQLIDDYHKAVDVDKKTREVKLRLAEGFLYHLGRAVRSYDNQVIAHQFCLAFRVLSQPIVEKAVGYFYEKRHVKALVDTAKRERRTLRAVVKCTKLYNQLKGWTWWRKFMEKANVERSSGLVGQIGRRVVLLKLYPYFDLAETLPVRPPRPLKEVEELFSDLPLESIQRKVAKERLHHVHVKAMLTKRRIQRDFLRAYASYVQVQIAIREVVKLIRKRQNLRLSRQVFRAFVANAQRKPINSQKSKHESQIDADIQAWFVHFFRERVRQVEMVNSLELT